MHERNSTESARFLHTLRLDMPPGKVVLEHAEEAFLGIIALFRTTGDGNGILITDDAISRLDDRTRR